MSEFWLLKKDGGFLEWAIPKEGKSSKFPYFFFLNKEVLTQEMKNSSDNIQISQFYSDIKLPFFPCI